MSDRDDSSHLPARLVSISLSGFRGFRERTSLPDLGRLNVIVGPNNVGKSTLLMPLRRLTRSDDRFVPKVGVPDGAGAFASLHTVKLFDTDRCGVPARIELTIDVPNIDSRAAAFAAEYSGRTDATFVEMPPSTVAIAMTTNGRDQLGFSFVPSTHARFRRSRDVSDGSRAAYDEHIADRFASKIIAELAGRIVYVPPTRTIATSLQPPDPAVHQERRYDGGSLAADLLSWHLPDERGVANREAIANLNEFCSRVFGQRTNVWPRPDGRVLASIGSEAGRSVSELGLGVAQIIVIGASLAAVAGPPILLLEEPEVCLHPGLQRALMRELAARDQQTFVTTHSNHLLDAVSDTRIFHVQYDAATDRRSVSAFDRLDLAVLADLGVTAGSIAAANTVLWVEGPSDAIYLRYWLSLHEATRHLREGEDYTFAFHGGALLAHFAVHGTKIVSFLAVHPSFYLVADSDRSTAGGTLGHDYLRRIQDDPSVRNRLWITETKEIEGYVPDFAFLDAHCASATATDRYAPLARRLDALGLAPSRADHKAALAARCVEAMRRLAPGELSAGLDLSERLVEIGAFVDDSRNRLPPLVPSSPEAHT